VRTPSGAFMTFSDANFDITDSNNGYAFNCSISGIGFDFQDACTATAYLINQAGLAAFADYSLRNTSNPRWIPDKAYVDTKTTLSDGLLHFDGCTFIPNLIPAPGVFDNSVADPSSLTNRLNFNGKFWATELRVGADYGSSNELIVNGTYGTYMSAAYYSPLQLNLSTFPDALIQNTSASVLQLDRPFYNLTGPHDVTGDIITVLDNPGNTGLISGSVLKATIGPSIVRVNMNPRCASDGDTAYLFDTDTSVYTSKLLCIKNRGTSEFALDASGVPTVNGLSGTGDRTLGVDSNGKIKIISSGTDSSALNKVLRSYRLYMYNNFV
jgi:hypothetical protein